MKHDLIQSAALSVGHPDDITPLSLMLSEALDSLRLDEWNEQDALSDALCAYLIAAKENGADRIDRAKKALLCSFDRCVVPVDPRQIAQIAAHLSFIR